MKEKIRGIYKITCTKKQKILHRYERKHFIKIHTTQMGFNKKQQKTWQTPKRLQQIRNGSKSKKNSS